MRACVCEVADAYHALTTAPPRGTALQRLLVSAGFFPERLEDDGDDNSLIITKA